MPCPRVRSHFCHSSSPGRRHQRHRTIAADDTALLIGGEEVTVDFTFETDNVILVLPPYSEVADPVPAFVYDGIFASFGPRVAVVPEFSLQFSINNPLPVKQGYVYCYADNPGCEILYPRGDLFSALPDEEANTGGVFVLAGTKSYVEGTIPNGTLTFSTVDGRPIRNPEPPIIPLPAPGLLLLGALGLLRATVRRSRV